MSVPRRVAAAVVLALVPAFALPPSGGAPATAAPGHRQMLRPSDGVHRATIERTRYGIPHVVADDYESLGFGHGFATAETSICLLADTLLTARGHRSRWFGADQRYSDEVTLFATNLQADALFTDIRNRRVVERLLADPFSGPGSQARARQIRHNLLRRYVVDDGR